MTVAAIQELKRANDRMADENAQLRERLELLEQAFEQLQPKAAGGR